MKLQSVIYKSINLPNHLNENGDLNEEKNRKNYNYCNKNARQCYRHKLLHPLQAENSNFKHRPIGLGIMGFQDALYIKKTPYASEEAVSFADESMEMVSYYAIKSSSDLASERGTYTSYEGSLWSKR